MSIRTTISAAMPRAAAWLAIGVFAGAAAAGGNRFKATGPDMGAGEGSELRTPLQFEAEAQNNPLAGSQVLFSRCRRAPFDAAGLYLPLAGPERDAIVGDTAFAFPDGSTCFNPQNEQNVVVNPANDRHLVTSANEYRANAHVAYVSMNRGATWANVVLPADPARRDAPVCMDWAIRSSTDNFAAQTRVSAQSSNPYIQFAGAFIGDYTGTALDASGKAVTVWTDFRGNPGVTKPNQDTLLGIDY